MDLSHPSTLLVPAGFAVLVVWRLVKRVRRLVGRQRLAPVRPWMTVVFFPLVVALLLLGAHQHPDTIAGLFGGAVLGGVLGWIGHRLTKFEATPQGLFYTPNAHLGIALSLLFIGRLIYRMAQLYMATGSFQPDAHTFAASGPLTLALFGTLAGYYVVYAIGLLRWRHSIDASANRG